MRMSKGRHTAVVLVLAGLLMARILSQIPCHMGRSRDAPHPRFRNGRRKDYTHMKRIVIILAGVLFLAPLEEG